MESNVTANAHVGRELKRTIKHNIAKAWYKLDKQSFEHWLEGRKMSQSELKYRKNKKGCHYE